MHLTQWLWTDRSAAARLARLALIPTSLGYQAAMAARAALYRAGLLPSRALPAPSVAVGNLTVGGSGKTPIASWIAAHYASRGLHPAVLLRGYGGDEGDVHRAQVGEAMVLEDPDRWAAAHRAVARGADVLVLDDAFQRLDVRRDLNIVLMSAESQGAVGWALPAGPWREGWGALGRADLGIVTRKRADASEAKALASRLTGRLAGRPVAIAHLAIGGFRRLVSGEPVEASALDGAQVVAATGVADPRALGDQLSALGASVDLLAFRDHYPYQGSDVTRLLEVAREVDYVVVTEKDAAKLARRWPDRNREPLVAMLSVVWEQGARQVAAALDAVVEGIGRGAQPLGTLT